MRAPTEPPKNDHNKREREEEEEEERRKKRKSESENEELRHSRTALHEKQPWDKGCQ